MDGTSRLLMWGERGLIATFFADLCQIDSEDVFNEFLSIVDFPKPIEAQAATPKSIDYIIEPDFGNRGFGHPDAVLAAEYDTAARAVFIVEAKRVGYARACWPKTKRATRGFNSTLNGQLELDYCLALALSCFKDGDRQLIEPGWIPSSRYERGGKGTRRSLKNRAVLDAVVSKLYGAPLERYYYIVIINEEENPLDKVNEVYLPELYKPEGSGVDLSFKDCWPEMRPRFGWLNYQKMHDFIQANKADMRLDSLFLESFEINRDNMAVGRSEAAMDSSPTTGLGTDSPAPMKTRYGASMIYAPKFNAQTFLYFYRTDKSCSLRDYSTSDETTPKARYPTISEVEQAIVEVFPLPRKRPNYRQVAHWHEVTKELNAEHSKLIQQHATTATPS